MKFNAIKKFRQNINSASARKTVIKPWFIKSQDLKFHEERIRVTIFRAETVRRAKNRGKKNCQVKISQKYRQSQVTQNRIMQYLQINYLIRGVLHCHFNSFLSVTGVFRIIEPK